MDLDVVDLGLLGDVIYFVCGLDVVGDVIYWYSQTSRPVHKLRFPLSTVPGRRLKSFGGIFTEINNQHLYRNHNNFLRIKLKM